MTLIASPSNPRISKLRTLHTARGRKKSGLFLMEGLNLFEALLAAQIIPYEIYYQPMLLLRTARGAALLDCLQQLASVLTHEHLIEVSERVIDALSETQTAQGIVCVLPYDVLDYAQILTRRVEIYRPALLILDNLTDPGNLGSILRTALAADVELVLLTTGCVDYCSPKVLRSAAGAHLMLPVEADLPWTSIEERIVVHCNQSRHIFLAEANGSVRYYDLDLTIPFALIIGNEAHGPSLEAQALATQTLSIPLAGGVESLNAAMASGIMLYESVRQLQMASLLNR